MPRFEKTHARKQYYCVLEHMEEILSLHEWEGNEERLVGYRKFESKESASNEMERLIAGRMKEGYAPVDDAAREICELLKLSVKEPEKLSLPIRIDLSVYNESCGFCIHNKSVMGKSIDDGSAKWKKAISAGNLIPLALTQDDPFTVRVCAGAELSEQESKEWVAKVETYLSLPDGELCITGGAEHIYGDEESIAMSSNYIHFLCLPKGNYKASVYTYLTGVNGSACLDELAGGYGKSEPLGKWFRQTHPGGEFPLWLQNYCIGDPEQDPGHEAEWQNKEWIPEEQIKPCIDFLLHLEPVDGAIPAQKPKLTEGWFEQASGARKPDECPTGIEAVNPRKIERKAASGAWIYPMNYVLLAEEFETEAIKSGPVEISTNELHLLYQISQFCSPHSVPQLRIAGSCGKQKLSPNGDCAHNTIAFHKDGKLQIAFDIDEGPQDLMNQVKRLSNWIAGLPDGTEIEYLSSTGFQEGSAEAKAGTNRFNLKVQQGKLLLESSFPKLSKEDLTGALNLARESENSESIKATNDAEAESIINYALSAYEYHFEDEKPKNKNGSITIKSQNRDLLKLLAASTFVIRYKEVFNATDLSEENDDELDGWD